MTIGTCKSLKIKTILIFIWYYIFEIYQKKENNDQIQDNNK